MRPSFEWLFSRIQATRFIDPDDAEPVVAWPHDFMLLRSSRVCPSLVVLPVPRYANCEWPALGHLGVKSADNVDLNHWVFTFSI